MSRKLTQLTIFVSGSSETNAEKSSIRLIVEDLSKILEKTHDNTSGFVLARRRAPRR